MIFLDILKQETSIENDFFYVETKEVLVSHQIKIDGLD